MTLLQQQVQHLKNVKPFYTKESLTPRFCRANKGIINAKKRQRKSKHKHPDQLQQNWSDAAKVLAKGEDGQTKEILAEVVKPNSNNKQHLVCIYKEPAGDAFTIHSVNTETS